MTKYSVIMPYFNRWDLTHARMFDLYRVLPDGHEICLVNDASTDNDTETGAAWWQKQMDKRHKIRYHKNKTNLGFGGSMNYGANKMATGNILVFLSNDVEVKNDFTAELDKIFADEHASYLIGGELITYHSGWNDIGNIFVPYANGWFLACRAEDWSKLGGFDPIYGRFDFEDVDLSMKALSLGFELIGVTDTKLRHLGGQTVSIITPDRAKHTIENMAKFHKKWDSNYSFLYDYVIEPKHVWSMQ